MMDPYGAEAPLVDPDDFPNWIILEDDNLLIINKPGWLVCHPSKNGPYSSLVGVVREYTGAHKLHLIARLDRETSGLVLFAKRPSVASKFQRAIQDRRVEKRYLAVLEGELEEPVCVDQPVARRRGGPVYVKSEVSNDRLAQAATTQFFPVVANKGYTLCLVVPVTGRKHQIRIHAEWLKRPVVGDKIYGPDETLYIEFVERGWTDRLEMTLPIKRQALHCYHYKFNFPDGAFSCIADLPPDLCEFCKTAMELDAKDLLANMQITPCGPCDESGL